MRMRHTPQLATCRRAIETCTRSKSNAFTGSSSYDGRSDSMGTRLAMAAAIKVARRKVFMPANEVVPGYRECV